MERDSFRGEWDSRQEFGLLCSDKRQLCGAFGHWSWLPPKFDVVYYGLWCGGWGRHWRG